MKLFVKPDPGDFLWALHRQLKSKRTASSHLDSYRWVDGYQRSFTAEALLDILIIQAQTFCGDGEG